MMRGDAPAFWRKGTVNKEGKGALATGSRVDSFLWLSGLMPPQKPNSRRIMPPS